MAHMHFKKKGAYEEEMADKEEKFEENVRGKYYVDSSCISCDACSAAAPENFKLDEDLDHAFVLKQPISKQEEDECKEALESCPVEAIGDDGEG